MSKEEKISIARKFYDSLNLVDYNLEIKRDEEINADFIWILDMRGPGGLIIADDGSYLFTVHYYHPCILIYRLADS
jgi:hypothetical protein